MSNQISVIVPAYNGAEFIGEALQSALEQTLSPAEIIVVDDCSTDDTVSVVKRWADRGPVRLIEMERNSGGPARPLNAGIAAAAGELIAVLDQDDRFAPTKLERQARALAEHADCSFAFALCASLNRPEMTLQPAPILSELESEAQPSATSLRLPGSRVLGQLVRQGNFIYGYPGVLFPRTAALAKGGVDEGLRVASDYDFFCWLCTQGDAAFVPEVLYLKRFHASNLCYARSQARREVCRVQRRYTKLEPWLAHELSMRDKLYRQLGGRIGLPTLQDSLHRAAEACKSLLRRCLPARVYSLLRSAWRHSLLH